ncbi:uncharacterized protein [Aegilops tauschii subsp. strangulata]|nr:wiskott-Aldrich syndrome protein family member 2 [Aegilops tauschii subsp. strangulata]
MLPCTFSSFPFRSWQKDKKNKKRWNQIQLPLIDRGSPPLHRPLHFFADSSSSPSPLPWRPTTAAQPPPCPSPASPPPASLPIPLPASASHASPSPPPPPTRGRVPHRRDPVRSRACLSIRSYSMSEKPSDDTTGQVRPEGDVSDVKVETANQDKGNEMPSAQQEEAVIKKKYGGVLPKKSPLISKDHERAYFDSADWALGKQGGHPQKPKGPLEALRPKLQPTQQQARSRRFLHASTDSDEGANSPTEATTPNQESTLSQESTEEAKAAENKESTE